MAVVGSSDGTGCVLLIWIIGQGAAALAVGACRGCLAIYLSLAYHNPVLSFLCRRRSSRD